MEDVARLAGGHPSTASRSLVDQPVRISSATVARVREAARSLGYRRDSAAASLRTGSSRLIGVLVPRLTDIVLATMYGGIDAAAAAHGYGAVVSNGLDDAQVRRDRLDALLARRIDGVILADARRGDTLADDLAANGFPYVLAMRTLPGHVSVSTDDVEGGRLAARHLLEQGHRVAGIASADPLASTGRDRSAGFREVYAAAGFPVPDSAVVASGFGVAAGRRAGVILAAAQPRLTAVFAVDDLSAIGVMGSLRDAGRTVGTDIALVGYNDIDLAADLPVPLTSVRSDMDQMGRLSLNLLLARIAGREVESVLLPPVLVPRASSLGRVG
ncbi:LacI family DNA-binding transcriptional regulator [Corynebacterium dentalis]|uniref:LacI family DNA-binding transcriptional regulator n=1 Tax=Corynebacterium dentalis TaxID=2014528 RepID=UPI0028983756|nr:LacI family DNA-binding transcriptional regulator [Corynebacterium dentalis]